MAIELQAEVRTELGRGAQKVRGQNRIPAELYGHGLENQHLSVGRLDFTHVFKKAGESSLVDLTVAGKKHPVLIHDVMYHPVTDEVLSVDFYQVRLDEKITLKVPVRFVGEAPAVKEKGGILVKALNEIEVEALPTNIPHQIDVDLSKLNDIGSSLHISELTVPKGVEILDEPTFVIATVTARMTEEQEAALAAEGTDLSAIKTEGEEKKEEAAEETTTDEAAPAA